MTDMSTTDDRRQTADQPQGGPRRDLYDAFDALPHDHQQSTAAANHLGQYHTEAAGTLASWLTGSDSPPDTDTILDALDATDLTLVLHTGQGVGAIRATKAGYERVSLLANDHQVHHLQAEHADDPRFSYGKVTEAALRDWLGEYTGDRSPVYEVIALAFVTPEETDVWEHANRAGVMENAEVTT